MEFGASFVIIIATSSLFLIFVCPLWIIMHYTTKRREAKTLLAEEEDALNQLLDAADRMEDRIGSLEKILEADDPNWKDKTQ